MTSFGERLESVLTGAGALCAGIDPHPWLLESWGLPVAAAGARDFGLRVVDAAAGAIGLVKPQVAFFERFGAAGYSALEEVLAAARAARLIVIADAKRGDIGSSVDAYAQAWLEPRSPLESDALTVSPYLGLGALTGTIDYARELGKGVFVLAATSNPEAAELQKALISREGYTRPLARAIIEDVRTMNQATPGTTGSVGVVVGATVDLAEFQISTEHRDRVATPVLAPGFGHQGARLDEAFGRFGTLTDALIVTESRSLCAAGPDGIRGAIRERAAELRRVQGAGK